jgi:hypothetical protein
VSCFELSSTTTWLPGSLRDRNRSQSPPIVKFPRFQCLVEKLPARLQSLEQAVSRTTFSEDLFVVSESNSLEDSCQNHAEICQVPVDRSPAV